jgi:hypothetical protein
VGRLLHFTRLEGGIVRERVRKSQRGSFLERRRAVGAAVAARIVEGLRRIVEGLCEIVEGLCLDRKLAKLLILIGSVGFSFGKPRKKLPIVGKKLYVLCQ